MCCSAGKDGCGKPPGASAGKADPPAFQKENRHAIRRNDFLGGGRWIRTTEVTDNRFTVCPPWPLGNSPIFTCALKRKLGAGRRTRTPDLLITNQLLYQLSYTSLLICFLSTDVLYYIISKTDCQEFFKNFLIFFTLGFISFCCAVTTDNILSQSQTFVNPFSTIF